MDYFGINSPEDLPRIKEVLAEQILLPTNVMEAMERSDSESANESAGPIIEETDLGAGEEN
jgi:segregation and condensation protein B